MRLRELRLEKGLLQKEVAADLGLERSKYVKYETGKVEPSLDILSNMADYYHISVDELLGHVPNTKKRPAEAGKSEAVMRLFDEVQEAMLTDAEADFLRAQIAGIKAHRKPR